MTDAPSSQTGAQRLVWRWGPWLAALLLAVASLLAGAQALVHAHGAHGDAHLHWGAHGHAERPTPAAERDSQHPAPRLDQPDELTSIVADAPSAELRASGAQVEFPKCVALCCESRSFTRADGASRLEQHLFRARWNALAFAERPARAPPRPVGRARKKRSTLASLLLTNRALRI